MGIELRSGAGHLDEAFSIICNCRGTNNNMNDPFWFSPFLVKSIYIQLIKPSVKQVCYCESSRSAFLIQIIFVVVFVTD